jgi:hypothetical protein
VSNAAAARVFVPAEPAQIPATASGAAVGAVVEAAAVPRRLALVLAPVEGESFASWVDRLAADHGLPPGLIAQAIGVPARANTGAVFRPRLYGILPTPEGVLAAGQATDVTPGRMAAMHLSRYDGTALDFTGLDPERESSVQRIAGRQWVLLHASRACPACLADSGGVWLLWWHLGVAACCPDHALLLEEVCPECGIRLRQGYRSRPRGLSKVQLTDPVRCGNHTPFGRCEQDLRHLRAEPVGERLAAWQRRVLQMADGAAGPLAGRQASGRVWFAALEGLSALVRFAAPACPLAQRLPVPASARHALAADQEADKRRSGGAPATLRTMPDSPALTLAVLAAVEPILTAATDDELIQALAPWVSAAAARRRALDHNPLRHLNLPAPLGEAVDRLMPRSSRVAAAAPTAPSLADLEIRHIPHLLDAGDYAELIAPHLPGTAEHSGRRLAALALARLAGATSWPQAGRELQMDPTRVARVTSTLVQRITDPDAFWQAATEAGRRLLARERVDYRQRRARLTDLTEVPHPVLFALYRPLGRPVTRRRRQLAAIWLWAHLTCGDFRDAPAWSPDEQASAESLAEVYRRFRDRLPAPVSDGLTAFGTTLLTTREGDS